MSVNSIAFSPDGSMFAIGGGDRTVILWNPETGAPIQTLEGHYGIVYAVAFSPDGRSLVSGSDDKTVCIWKIRAPAGAEKK